MTAHPISQAALADEMISGLRVLLAAAERRRAADAPVIDDPPGYYRFVVPASAVEWLRTGERGISSEAIFERMTGIPIQGTRTATEPSDPDDLRRCRALLAAVPEFHARLTSMATVSARWAKLVGAWSRLGVIFEEENAAREAWRAGGQKGAAPIWNRTWAAMSRLLYGEPPPHLRHLPDEIGEAK